MKVLDPDAGGSQVHLSCACCRSSSHRSLRMVTAALERVKARGSARCGGERRSRPNCSATGGAVRAAGSRPRIQLGALGSQKTEPWSRRIRRRRGGNLLSQARLLREHLLQGVKYRIHSCRTESAESSCQTLVVDGSKLVQCYKATSLLKSTGDAPWIGVPTRCHRRDQDRSQMEVQLIWRNNEAGPRLSNLTALGGIKPHEVHFTPLWEPADCHHVHSSASNFVGVGASSILSSPRARMARAASAQPFLGLNAARTIIRPGSA